MPSESNLQEEGAGTGLAWAGWGGWGGWPPQEGTARTTSRRDVGRQATWEHG